MSEFDAIVADYSVATKKRHSIVNYLAYLSGIFLLLAPFIKGFAVPMAVFSLSYFAFVFVALTINDVRMVIFKRFGGSLFEFRQFMQFGVREIFYFVVSWRRFIRNTLAFRRARARWETWFFSSRVTSPNVLARSLEKNIGS